MRSDSELVIFIFRSEKKMGLLMQSDFAKSDGKNQIKNPTTPPIGLLSRKMASVFNQVKT